MFVGPKTIFRLVIFEPIWTYLNLLEPIGTYLNLFEPMLADAGGTGGDPGGTWEAKFHCPLL